MNFLMVELEPELCRNTKLQFQFFHSPIIKGFFISECTAMTIAGREAMDLLLRSGRWSRNQSMTLRLKEPEPEPEPELEILKLAPQPWLKLKEELENR